MKMTAARVARIDAMTMVEFASPSRTARRDYLRQPMSGWRIHAIRRKLYERMLKP